MSLALHRTSQGIRIEFDNHCETLGGNQFYIEHPILLEQEKCKNFIGEPISSGEI